jgi:hypothetical protein
LKKRLKEKHNNGRCWSSSAELDLLPVEPLAEERLHAFIDVNPYLTLIDGKIYFPLYAGSIWDSAQTPSPPRHMGLAQKLVRQFLSFLFFLKIPSVCFFVFFPF